MENNVSLLVAIENARMLMIEAFNQVQEKTRLPVYLMEGIVLDLLSQIRNQKNIELVVDLNRIKGAQDKREDGE